MIDVVIACIVIGLPSTIALVMLDRGSRVSPTYRTRVQELGAAGVFHDYRAPRRRAASLGLPELDMPVRPVEATSDRGDAAPIAPLPGASVVAPPLATLHP